MDYEKLRNFLNKYDYFINDIGIEIERITEGYARARLTHGERHRNANGSVNGGALYTLADITGAAAASSYGKSVTTVTGTANYINAVSADAKIHAVARVIKYGRRIINIDVQIVDDFGKLYMQSDLTFYNLGKDLDLGD